MVAPAAALYHTDYCHSMEYSRCAVLRIMPCYVWLRAMIMLVCFESGAAGVQRMHVAPRASSAGPTRPGTGFPGLQGLARQQPGLMILTC
jgi:hypothetical protein